MAWVGDNGDDLRQFGDRIGRRIVKGVRRAIGAPEEAVEGWTDQWRKNRAMIDPQKATLRTFETRSYFSQILKEEDGQPTYGIEDRGPQILRTPFRDAVRC
jgi:hypothetical protein